MRSFTRVRVGIIQLTSLLLSDAVFGVKSSLVVDLKEIHDEEKAKALGFKSAPYYLLERDVSMIYLSLFRPELAS